MMHSEDQRKAQHAAYTAVMNSRANELNQASRKNNEEQRQALQQPNHEQLQPQPQPQSQPQQPQEKAQQIQHVSRPRGQSSSSSSGNEPSSNYPNHAMQLPPWMLPNNQNVPVPFTNVISAPKFTWRKGKWSEEEELYTKKLIDAFNSGCLKIASGTTLRSFLAERLFCDPMRITKKFAGSNCTGKQVFVPHSGRPDETMLDQLQHDLKTMENKFISKFDCQHRQLSYRDQMGGSTGQPPGFVVPPYMNQGMMTASGSNGGGTYMNQGMMTASGSNSGGTYPPELLASMGMSSSSSSTMGGFPMYHPHQMASHLHGVPVMHGLHHPSMLTPEILASLGVSHNNLSAPPGTTFPMSNNGFYGFPPSFMAPGSMSYMQNNQGGSNKGATSSESSDSDPENSSARIALANETIRLSGSNVMSQHHANEAILRQDRHQILHHPLLQSGHHSTGSSSAQSMQPSSSSSSSATNNGQGVPVYRSRQSYTSAELFGYQYPTTLEHMALLSSENLEAATSRKKRNSNGDGTNNGGGNGGGDKIPQRSKLGTKSNKNNGGGRSTSSKGTTSGSGSSSNSGHQPTSPTDLDASTLLLNFFQSTASTNGSVSGSSTTGTVGPSGSTTINHNHNHHHHHHHNSSSDNSNINSDSNTNAADSGLIVSTQVTNVSNNSSDNSNSNSDNNADEHKNKKIKINADEVVVTDVVTEPVLTTRLSATNLTTIDASTSATSTATGKEQRLTATELLRETYKSRETISSGSGRTSNGSGTGSGDGENDDSASTFSDAADADASNSISGRSCSLSSFGGHRNSDQSDYSSPDEKEEHQVPTISLGKPKRESTMTQQQQQQQQPQQTD